MAAVQCSRAPVAYSLVRSRRMAVCGSIRTRWCAIQRLGQGAEGAAAGPARQPVASAWCPAVCATQQQARRASRCYASAAQSSGEDVMEVEIKVGGMMCDGCTSRVAEALQKEAGVTRVEVSLEKAMASIEVQAPSPLEAYQMLPKLVETVKALGFEAEPHIAGL